MSDGTTRTSHALACTRHRQRNAEHGTSSMNQENSHPPPRTPAASAPSQTPAAAAARGIAAPTSRAVAALWRRAESLQQSEPCGGTQRCRRWRWRCCRCCRCRRRLSSRPGVSCCARRSRRSPRRRILRGLLHHVHRQLHFVRVPSCRATCPLRPLPRCARRRPLPRCALRRPLPRCARRRWQVCLRLERGALPAARLVLVELAGAPRLLRRSGRRSRPCR